MKKVIFTAIATTLAFGVATQASADPEKIDGFELYNSGPGYVQTQGYNVAIPSIKVEATAAKGGNHPSAGGEPGVGVSTLYKGMTVKISGFASSYKDANGIAPVSAKMAGLPPSHAGMGYFNFAQVASDPVYFGEWSATGTPDDATHTAFYAGSGVTTDMPQAGTATYLVKGINQYSGNNLLTGTLDADFGQKTLVGDIASTTMNVNIDSKISGSTFSGTANTGGLNGISYGQFFGNAAASVAGVAQFTTDHTKDTAFGGTKQ